MDVDFYYYYCLESLFSFIHTHVLTTQLCSFILFFHTHIFYYFIEFIICGVRQTHINEGNNERHTLAPCQCIFNYKREKE